VGRYLSRDTNSICRTCGVYEPGDGLNATLLDFYTTVEDFDAALMDRWGMKAEDLPADHQNWRIRNFIIRHAGHQIEYWSWDWAYGEEDPLEGLERESH
jgi:hypothetical protein